MIHLRESWKCANESACEWESLPLDVLAEGANKNEGLCSEGGVDM